jgi:host factor-I protein
LANTRKKKIKLTDRYLAEAREGGLPSSLYLVNGFQLKGEVMEFDDESVLFKHKGVHQLVMRSAVASMYPLAKTRQGEDEWWRAYYDAEAVKTPDA